MYYGSPLCETMDPHHWNMDPSFVVLSILDPLTHGSSNYSIANPQLIDFLILKPWVMDLQIIELWFLKSLRYGFSNYWIMGSCNPELWFVGWFNYGFPEHFIKHPWAIWLLIFAPLNYGSSEIINYLLSNQWVMISQLWIVIVWFMDSEAIGSWIVHGLGYIFSIYFNIDPRSIELTRFTSLNYEYPKYGVIYSQVN